MRAARDNSPPWIAPSGALVDRVPMRPTSFRTHRLALVGVSDAARIVVPPTPYAQRVIATKVDGGGTFVILSPSAPELEVLGNATSGGAFQIPDALPTVFTIGPNESLYAAAAIATADLSISISQAVPWRAALERRITRSTFRTFSVVPDPIHLAQESEGPQRVLMQIVGLGAVEISDKGNVEGDTYLVIGPSSHIFVKAPHQALYGSAVAGTVVLSVHVSDVAGLRGPTGILGPDGQE